MSRAALAALAILGLAASSAQAAVVRGTVVRAEGRPNASCRLVGLKRDDGIVLYFRLPSTSDGDGMLSVALTALVSRLQVEVQYDPAVPSACGGSEPNIDIIALLGA